MVTVSSLDKISTVGKLSDCLAISQSSMARDHKADVGGEDGNPGIPRVLSRSVNQNLKVRSDMYLDPTSRNVDRHFVGVIGPQNESSLFSSSLSDLVHHKMKLSESNFLSRPSSTITSQKDDKEPLKSHEETEGQMINNLLPDEEELFSGMVDEIGHKGHANAIDDLDDFDLFTCTGGIELEADDHSQATRQNVGYPWGLQLNQQRNIHRTEHSSGNGMHSIPRLPNGGIVGDGSPHREGARVFNGFQSPVRLPSVVGSEFGLSSEASQAFSHLQLDSRPMPGFHSHSPQLQQLRSVPGIADDISEKVNLDVRHLGLNGHAVDLNDGIFGYSSNGIPVHPSMASKSNSYQQHHLRSLLMSNSPSFLHNNHTSHIGRLPGSPGAQHLMMNMVSPMQHNLHVGSAPVMKASLWDRQPIYTGESHDASPYSMNALRGVAIPGFSPSHPREISSHGSLPRVHGMAEVPKNPGLHSPQQMSHMFHERNPMNSLPTSFGSPNERARSRRHDSSLSHADRKHYELNLDRILRGDDTRTTLMIKNIPNKYTSKMLLATIDEHHKGKYDFIYLPIDFKNKCNMGYAFINMVDPLQIVSFHQTFEGRKWEKFNSEKVATLAYARIQGKGALIAHFQNSSLMNEDKRCRPILFHTDGPNAGDQEPFPMGTNFRAKPGRLQAAGGDEDE